MEQYRLVRQVVGPVLAVVICLLPGLVGSIFTSSAIDSWYADLEKPAFNPPDWVFGPVWTVLYVLMGISLYLLWSRGNCTRHWRLLIAVFAVQLALNALWSLAFFGLESPIAGLSVIVPLWMAILGTVLLGRRYSGIAAMLLVPYLAWVTFATLLNYWIWQLN